MEHFDTTPSMDWNATLESDGQQFVTLDEGDYAFTVTGFERGRFPGGAKIPACHMAILTLTVDLPDGNIATCRENLILHRSLEWKLASFFRAIGQKRVGEQITMDWSKVKGATGRAHFKPRTYTTSTGEERKANAVDHYYDYTAEDVSFYID